ncbi:short-chain collagen C4-like [Mercenaria mercenaria]|uniref:short-chain collagen C4-like n=1 Tax=Mercenaria mercenaria TaxID=6596 RepID=UPI00234FAD66|nr:short-chain collagen C4-like [Mercenaria mercenaria]
MRPIAKVLYLWIVYCLSYAEMDQRRFVAEIDIETKMNNLENELTALKALVGHTYIRWGRTICQPVNGTELLYSGYMVGDKWDQSGGGSNNLCIPEVPTWGQYVDGYNGGAEIRGTEIESDATVSNLLFGKAVDNHDVPCAVCRSNRASHVMIPGRTTCYPGWTEEYRGYVVASKPTWASNSDYICLDSMMEFVAHGAGNDNEHVVRPAEVRCGSIPCPP